jgi:transcriptional regulator with XRE-family HTH domain
MAKPSPLHSGHPALVALGRAIRQLRSKQGLSQEGLAHEIGLDRSYIGGIERGEHNLTLMNLLKIAEKLGIDPSELLKQANL